jgi:pyruvate dehydrogenase E2 component (dihydrolipoamide acetyltransferase)
MANGVLMPKIGITVESCVITEWRKKPGDPVETGEVLFSYETDKAAFECESTASGTLLEIFYGNGDEVPVLTNVCAIGSPGDDISALRPAPPENGDGAHNPPEPAPSEMPVTGTAKPDSSSEIKISPRARHAAEMLKIDYRAAEATGPYGRIIERDIRNLAKSGAGMTSAVFSQRGALPGASLEGSGIGGRIRTDDIQASRGAQEKTGAGFTDVAFSGIRKAISKSMTQSLSTIPQLTHNFSFDATEIMELRGKIKAKGDFMGLQDVGIGDMINFAVSRILPEYPSLNAHMLDDFIIRQFSDVNMGFACDTERGLMVPVIKAANRKSLPEIASETKSLARQAQSGSLSPDCMSGGTFTVSNLGPYGVESFTPVIYPPQTGILGVCRTTQRLYEENGQIKLRPAITLSLTYDHRAIDGAPASRFMKALCEALENFTIFLLAKGGCALGNI